MVVLVLGVCLGELNCHLLVVGVILYFVVLSTIVGVVGYVAWVTRVGRHRSFLLASLLEELTDKVLIDTLANISLRLLALATIATAKQLRRNERGLIAFAELGEFLIESKEHLELDGFADGWDQGQFL